MLSCVLPGVRKGTSVVWFFGALCCGIRKLSDARHTDAKDAHSFFFFFFFRYSEAGKHLTFTALCVWPELIKRYFLAGILAFVEEGPVNINTQYTEAENGKK